MKNLLNIGKPLTKEEQKSVIGGVGDSQVACRCIGYETNVFMLDTCTDCELACLISNSGYLCVG